MNFKILVINVNHPNGVVNNWSWEEARSDWEECGSIDGGQAYLIGYCPAFDIEHVLDMK